MDDSLAPRSEAIFAPDRRYTWLAAGGVLPALAAYLLSADAAGRLLAAIATVVLVCCVAADLVFTPRLVVSPTGMVVRAPLTRARFRWDEVDDVRADTHARFGVRSTTLEIDAGAALVVLSQRALGADPEDVAALAATFRPR